MNIDYDIFNILDSIIELKLIDFLLEFFIIII